MRSGTCGTSQAAEPTDCTDQPTLASERLTAVGLFVSGREGHVNALPGVWPGQTSASLLGAERRLWNVTGCGAG